MSNWLKKMFFGKECSCEHCHCCGDEKEMKAPVGANVSSEKDKPAENVEKAQ